MKVECPDCGKTVPTTSHPLFYCEKPRTKVTVQHVPMHPELPAPTGTVRADELQSEGTVSTVHLDEGTVQDVTGTVHLPKNRKWEAANSDRNRVWRKEYDRLRRNK